MPKVPEEAPKTETEADTPIAAMSREEFYAKILIACAAADGAIGFVPTEIPEKANVAGIAYAAYLQLLGDEDGAKAERVRVEEIRERMNAEPDVSGSHDGYNTGVVREPLVLTTDPPVADDEIVRAFEKDDVERDPLYSDLIGDGLSPEAARESVIAMRSVPVPVP